MTPLGSSAGCASLSSAQSRDEQDGYVPNVVYSCGALLHGGTLVIPYGIGDSAIGVATVSAGRASRLLEGHPRLTHDITTSDWRHRCPTDPHRSHLERNLASPSRRSGKPRRRSETSGTRRLIAWDRDAERPVRIAVLAPIAWRVPPRHYGPWELFASLLTEGLVSRGHDVTLFATGDSENVSSAAQRRSPRLVRGRRHQPEGGRVPPYFGGLRAGV